jgi:hypothetical protein
MKEAMILPALNGGVLPRIKFNCLTQILMEGANDHSAGLTISDSERQVIYVEYMDEGERKLLAITGDSGRDVGELYYLLMQAQSEYYDDYELSLFIATPPEEIVITWEQSDKPLRYIH